jgi:hypothetical protein
MRMDLPHELPRRREPETAPASRPLGPTPLELVREELRKQAEERRGPQNLRSRQAASVPRKARRRELENTVPRDPVSRRAKRNELPQQLVDLSLREQEVKALGEIGRFRVLATRDLAESVYGGRASQLARDLRFLEQHGLVKIESVNARRDGRAGKTNRLEVVTLTKAGRDVVRQTGNLPQDQMLYARLVKPREVEHDTQIYRAYQKEAQRIEEQGGTNLRVRLDFELKAQIQKAIYAERKADPERDMNEIKQQVAQQFDLPFVNNGIQIPDARIQYDLDQGSRTGHQDIEVLTAAYRPGHLRGKAQAGFRLYASGSDRATLTAKIENDHHLLDNILEL